jgi:hypothetical protein
VALAILPENIMFLTKNTAKTRGMKTSSEAQDRGWSVAIV